MSRMSCLLCAFALVVPAVASAQEGVAPAVTATSTASGNAVLVGSLTAAQVTALTAAGVAAVAIGTSNDSSSSTSATN